MVDLDHFKTINDTHGHDAGDAVLQHVARILQTSVRSGDLVARCGGEEFTIILSGPIDQPALAERVESIRQAIENSNIVYKDITIPVTASIGVYPVSRSDIIQGSSDNGSSLRVETEDERLLEEFLRRADTALYQAKNTGRNRAVMWQLGMEMPAEASET
jgi:GGDEF domain-containing protein